MAKHRPGRGTLLAFALALLLGGIWTIRDWANLSALRLPDTDDVVRLQQIRDWIAGQPYSVVTQRRLGPPPGLSMHWSRLPDLVPGGIIALLTPIMRTHTAELVAVVAWPLVLFGTALALVGAIARALAAPAATAILVAALAYPATTLFLPGRIDHHGLQVVLMLLLAWSTLRRASVASGAAAGLAMTASLVVGLETAPLLATGAAILLLRWIACERGEEARMLGLGVMLPLTLAGSAMLFRSDGWDYPACDGFTRITWQTALILAFVPTLLAALASRLGSTRVRLIVAVVVGAAALAIVAPHAQACLNPYDTLDPMLTRAWLSQVGEAQSLVAAPRAQAIGYAGLLLVGLAAGTWQAWRFRGGWVVLLTYQLTCLAVTMVQLRGAYAGAILAAPALATIIAAARSRGLPALAAAWIASAGLIYPLAANRAFPPSASETRVIDCTTPAALTRIAQLPRGRLLASTDLSAYALAAGPQNLLGGPYHRNQTGNMAMYRFFLGTPSTSRAIARHHAVTHVAFCPGDFSELGPLPAGSLAANLSTGRTPAWLELLPGTDPMLYRVR